MPEIKLAKAYERAADEKLTPVILYTQNAFVRGDAVCKENIRVSTWLRTAAMPEFVALFNAQMLVFGGGAPQSSSFNELLVPSAVVIAYHMVPPAKDQLDYDEREPNRKLEPCTLLVGTFRIQGFMRISVQLTIGKSLEVGRTSFLSLYDAEVSNPGLPNLGVMRVPMLLFRPTLVSYGMRTS